MPLSNFIIITGHYGSGKTNLALNLAVDYARQGEKVTVMDLDIVNPYFRTSDYKKLLCENQIKVIASPYAGSTLDIPALSAEMYSVFDNPQGRVIIDVGGDDAGAAALGRFAPSVEKLPSYDMLYVVNRYRKLTESPEQAIEILREIETMGRVKATAVVNNSHLCTLTTPEDILGAAQYGARAAQLANLPLVMTTAPESLVGELSGKVENLRGVHIYVNPPWRS